MPAPFVHLRLHSEYSLVDSTVRIPGLVKAAAKAGMPAIALTDDSNVFAMVKFYKAAEKAGIQPIAGCDVWVRDGDEVGRATLLVQDHGIAVGTDHLQHEIAHESVLHFHTNGLDVIDGGEQLAETELFEVEG